MSPLPTYYIIQAFNAAEPVCVTHADYYPTVIAPKPVYRLHSVAFAPRAQQPPLAFADEAQASEILFAIRRLLPTLLDMKVVAVAADPTKFHVAAVQP